MTSINILIVEPDGILLQTIADHILGPAGYQLFAVQAIDEGLEIALADRPDLMVLHLPSETATSFLKNCANAYNQIPVILIVDETSTAINAELLKLGVKDYVVWPVTPQDLLGAVDQVVNNLRHSLSYVNTPAKNYEFADMASHLLRNPLNVIQTSIRCLQTLDLSYNEQQDLYNKMWNQCQRMTEFTNELLKTLRLEVEGALVCAGPVALAPLIERTIDFVKHEKPDLTFSLSAGQHILPAAGDGTKIEMVVLNLLFGAIRRCKAGGHINVSLTQDVSEVLVSVKDDGRPIPVSSLDQVFRSYYPVGNSKSNVPATYQLGMYTTKRLVELHHGRVWAQNHNGQGSEFGFSLPIWRQHS